MDFACANVTPSGRTNTMSIILRVALVAVASTVLTANAMAQKVHKQSRLQPFTVVEKAWFDRASQQSNGGAGGDN
jgi:hypothetical protein